MKKIFTLLLVLTISSLLCFAVANNHKVYSVTDDVYKDIEKLYVASGKALPSSSGPWTGDELLSMLNRIDRNSFKQEAWKALYDEAFAKLQPSKTWDYETWGIKLGLDANAEAYYHEYGYKNALDQKRPEIRYNLGFNPDPGSKETVFDYNGKSNWFHSDRKDLLKFKSEVWAGSNFYGYFEYGIKVYPWDYLYGRQFFSNIMPIKGFKEAEEGFDAPKLGLYDFFAAPKKALASAGGKNWSLIAGRDKLSWGSGETGNMMLSKSFDMHTFAQFTTFHDKFQYTLLGTIYPYYDGVYSNNKYKYGQDGPENQFDGYKSLIAHRLEFKLLKDKLNLAVTESCMFRVKPHEEGFSIAMINPFGFMHNEYIRQNSNSLMVFEGDYALTKGLNVYGQFALDDFALPGASDTTVPTATGKMVGVKADFALGSGILSLNGEYAVTDPFLFLRGVYEKGNEYGKTTMNSYGFGFDALTRFFSEVPGGIYVENDFITYTYGNDVKLYDVKANYNIPGKAEFTAEYMLMKHGVMNINSPWGMKNGADDTDDIDVKTPSEKDPYAGTTGVVQTSRILSLGGSFKTPLKGLKLNAVVDFINADNYKNKEGNTFKDMQVTAGLSYSL